MKFSNKEMGKVVKAAVKRGWIVKSGGSHPKIIKGYHIISASLSPSCAHAAKSLDRMLRKCEDGTCVHDNRR